jgi:hypothetical protein
MTSSPGFFLRKVYYRMKPFVPRGLRWAIRRKRAFFIRKQNTGTWPINPAAATTPSNWPGWPEGKRFAFVLTHDVEALEGVQNVRQLAELEATYQLRSSFNFIPQGGYDVPDSLRAWLHDQGCEVGVHDLYHDGKLYNSRNGFLTKAKQINQHLSRWGAVGFRSGFMLRQLDWLHELNVEYDASTFDTDPFEPQPDGCRTIFPFIVRDPNRPEQPGYVELPYTLPQDSTLFLLLEERSADIWKHKLDWIASHGGLALINIHPDYIDFQSAGFENLRYPASMIEDLLNHLTTHYSGQFWNPLPKELAAWYRSTSDQKIPASPPASAMDLTPRA